MSSPSRDVKTILDEAFTRFASVEFIPNDPILIPHRFSRKEDIEIAGFLAATIAWGQRITIINNATQLIELMDNSPHDFIVNHEPKDRLRFRSFVHRTFNGVDAMFFMERLQDAYKEQKGLEALFGMGSSTMSRLTSFHEWFFAHSPDVRTKKHVSNPDSGSAAKRLNMFLRWMVRSNSEGVDFGIWKSLSPAELMIPLDVHTGRVARKLALVKRKQNDWKTVQELTDQLKKLDPDDPIKYDLALFGLGVEGELR